MYPYRCSSCGFKLTEETIIAHRRENKSHKIVFTEDKRRSIGIRLGWRIHILLTRRLSVKTIMRIIREEFGKDLTENDLWRLETHLLIPSHKPSDITAYSKAVGGYDGGSIGTPMPLESNSFGISRSENKKGLKEEGIITDFEAQNTRKERLGSTYGKLPIGIIPDFTTSSRAQYEARNQNISWSRREQRVERQIQEGKIPEKDREAYVSGEIPLPRGKAGGRKPKDFVKPKGRIVVYTKEEMERFLEEIGWESESVEVPDWESGNDSGLTV